MQKSETELAIEHLQKVGGAAIQEMLRNAARVGNVDIALGEMTFKVPARSMYKRANGEAFPLSGEIKGSQVFVDAPGGGQGMVDRLAVLLQTVACGTTGSAFTDKAGTWQKFCDTLPWGSIDLDEQYVAVKKPDGALGVFQSLREGVTTFGMKPGQGLFVAPIKARSQFLAREQARALPSDAWQRKTISPFGEVQDHG